MRCLTYLMVVLCALAVKGYGATEPLVVYLEGENKVSPLFISPWQIEGFNQAPSYLQELAAVLRFDLGHSGLAQVVAETPERLAALSCPLSRQGRVWQQLGIDYVIMPLVSEGGIALRIFSPSENAVKQLDKLPLTGVLAEDRRQVHRLSDALIKQLFGCEGVASTHILYTVRKGPDISEIWEMDCDGANAMPLQKMGYCVTPAYMPPAKGCVASSYAYVSYVNGQPKLYLAPRAGGQHQRMSWLRGNQLMPAFNRQRTALAFISDASGNPDLFVQDFDVQKGLGGKPRQLFTARHATQGSPTWSPDGKNIAVVSDKDGVARIYLIEVPTNSAEPKAPRLITKRYRESTAPSWSPDGRYIAYTSMTNGTRQIWLYELANQSETQLTEGPGHKENPSWSPNSLHIVYNSSTQGAKGSSSELYFVTVPTRQVVQLTHGEGESRFPCWEPR